MKIIRTGIFCLGLCVVSWAQQPGSDDLQQIDPTTGKAVATQPTAPVPQQAQPPATPQPAAPQGAAPQRPSPVVPPDAPQDQPAAPTTGPTITVAPELPKYPDVRMPSETGWSIGL